MEPRTVLSAMLVMDYNFARTVAEVGTVDGAAVGASFTGANLKDSSGNSITAQVINGASPVVYAHSGGLLPSHPEPLPVGWDGKGVFFDGTSPSGIRNLGPQFGGSALLVSTFAGSFSVLGRIHLAGDPTAYTNHLLGSSSPRGGWELWQLYVAGSLNTLQFSAPGLTVPTGVALSKDNWYDFGVSFEGATGDATPDTVRIYVDGTMVAEQPGVATFDPNVDGTPFAIGFASNGPSPRRQFVERVAVWSGVLSPAEFQALSAPAPGSNTTTIDFDGTDEPFYTTPGVGATLSLAQVNSVLNQANISLQVGSANAAAWQLMDFLADHFLSGSIAGGGADFFGTFMGDATASHIAVDVAYFNSSTYVTLTAYAQPIVTGTRSELHTLSVVGTQVVHVGGGADPIAYLDLSFATPARSFSIEISSDATTLAINRVEWTAGGPAQPGDPPFNPPPEATDVGEWHQFRGNGRLTGRAELTGNVSDPQILWSEFIGSRESWLALTMNGGASGSQALPFVNLSMSQSEQASWKVGNPTYDLDGTGSLTSIVPWTYYKIGNFLPGTPDLEKVELTLTPQLDGYLRLYRRQGGVWVSVWQSQQIPLVTYGPNVIVGDFDNDSELEVAITAWYDVWMFDLTTGGFEGKASFNPPTSESGRPYGWLGAADLNNDGRDEFVVLGDFENKIGVVGWNAGGALTTLWTRAIEVSPIGKQTVHHPGVDPIQDINGDGLPEVVTSIYNEGSDQKWHVMAFDGTTGAVMLNLPDHYLYGMRDTDGDGVAELFTTVAPAVSGPRPPETGHLKLLSFEGNVLSLRWEQFDTAYQTGAVQDFPLNVNSIAGTGRTTIQAGPITSDDALPTLFTRRAIGTGDHIEITAWRHDGQGAIVALGAVTGPNASVLATRPAAMAEAGVLVRTEVFADAPAQATFAGFSAQPAFSTLVGPPQTSPVVGRLAGQGKPTVIVQGAGEKLVALHTNTATGAVSTVWVRDGRGEYTGGSQFTGQNGFGNVVLADILGNASLATIAATRGADGQARMIALAPDGTEIWHTDFEFPGAPPEWNIGGLTTWKAGRFRSVDHDDVLVSLRRSTFQNDSYYLLDGLTGDVVWTRDWGNPPGVAGQQRGGGGSQLAVYDWDGDGLDEALNLYPDVFYVVEGNGANAITRDLILSIYPNVWPQGGIPIVDDFLDNATATILHTGSPNVVGLLDKNGLPIWSFQGQVAQFSPAVGDFDGDGDLEIFLDGKAYDPRTGALLWTPSLPGTPSPGVSADIDGDGRDEAIVTIGNVLYVIGATQDGAAGQIEWSMAFAGTLGMPTVADSDGDGRIEILVVSTDGRIHAVGQPTLPGDANFDSAVDIFDVNWVSMHWGTSGPPGDVNRDGVVDIFDVNDVSANWGAPNAAQGASTGAMRAPSMLSEIGTPSGSPENLAPRADRAIGRAGEAPRLATIEAASPDARQIRSLRPEAVDQLLAMHDWLDRFTRPSRLANVVNDASNSIITGANALAFAAPMENHGRPLGLANSKHGAVQEEPDEVSPLDVRQRWGSGSNRRVAVGNTLPPTSRGVRTEMHSRLDSWRRDRHL